MSDEKKAVLRYYQTFFGLMGLTLLTVLAAFVNLGPFSLPAALGIAMVKATLVLIFFMHLLHSEKLTQICVGIALFTLALLLIFSFNDYMTRRQDVKNYGSTWITASLQTPSPTSLLKKKDGI